MSSPYLSMDSEIEFSDSKSKPREFLGHANSNSRYFQHIPDQNEKKSTFQKIRSNISNTRIKMRRWNLLDLVSQTFYASDTKFESYSNVLERFSFFYEYNTWTESFDRKLRHKNLILLLFSCLGIIIMIISNILNFQWWYSKTSSYSIYSPEAQGPEIFPLILICQILKCINVVVTFAVLISLISYYISLASEKKKRWGYASNLIAFFSSSLWRKFLLEFIVLSITPIPFIDWFFPSFISDITFFKIDILMFLRLYLFVRLVRDYSSSYQKRSIIIAQNEDYKKQLPEFGWQLSIKLLFINNTLSVLIVLSVTTTLIASFCIWFAERDTGNKAMASFYNTIYFTLVTEMTIGFGDIVPSGTFGRMTALMQGLLGILLISIFSGVVINKLNPTEQQKIAVEFLQKERAQKKRLIAAMRILQVQWLFKKGKCTTNYRHNTIRSCIKDLQRTKKILYKLNARNRNDEIMDTLLKKQKMLQKNIKSLTNTIQEIQQLASKLTLDKIQVLE